MKHLHRFGFHKKVALSMAVLLLVQACFPLGAFALTSGPTQPEFNEFEPVGTTQMVDLFSGDFTYNIPLFELPGPNGGYPFNLSYHSGITMDQEASWVGLGWSLNNGAINRTMRGIPDDFEGDQIERKMDMKENKTWEVGVHPQGEAVSIKLKQLAGGMKLGLGLRLTHNNYRGFGLGLNTSLSTKKTLGPLGAYASLGVSSTDGATFTPSLSLGGAKSNISLSLSINSRNGMEGLSFSLGRKAGKKSGAFASIGNSISFAKPAYTPQVASPYKGSNFSASLEIGGYSGFFASFGGVVDVTLSKQGLRYKNIWTKAPSYGYFNLDRPKVRNQNGYSEEGIEHDALMDFNREKDGTIRKTTSNLATPFSTPDIYSVTGQGTGGSYRAYRSDVGIFSDPVKYSYTAGQKFGVDLNVGGGFDIGADHGTNFSLSSSNKLANGNDLETLQFRNSIIEDEASMPVVNTLYEPYYFKSAGEVSAEPTDFYDYIGGSEAVRLKLNGDRQNFDTEGVLEEGIESSITAEKRTTVGYGMRAKRKPRASSIQPIKNEELMLNGNTALAEYKAEYFEYNSSTPNNYDKENLQPYSRTADVTNHPSHIAGITALQANGMRYVYGLPVKNKVQEEIVFSANNLLSQGSATCPPLIYEQALSGAYHKVSGTDEYLNHTKTPEYVHTHLLTAVLGADYVDLDGIEGPSDGDYGYWVKFNYVKTSDNYKWRTPFYGAKTSVGHFSDNGDDKASILYGEREQYYLATAETKTHIAEFAIQPRDDAKGAASLLQHVASTGESSYKLERIDLYSKLERYTKNPVNNTSSLNENAVPIKSVVFDIVSDLCKNTHNSNGAGKATLKKIHFEYQNNTRGSLSPYKFFYENDKNYSDYYFDRWGTYRAPRRSCDVENFPYTYQAPSNQQTEASFKQELDNNASAWHLTKIQLPSGANIDVTYESDDYAYVQDRVATQMFNITGVGEIGNNIINTNSVEGFLNLPSLNPMTDEDLRIYFDKEPGNDDMIKYLDDLHGKNIIGSQLMFKIMVDLNNSGANEYVSGYARIADYTEDYIELEPVEVKGKQFHPFAVTAWQYLRLNFPSKIKDGEDLNSSEPENLVDAAGGLVDAFGEIKEIFRRYHHYCSSKELGSKMVLENSYIRLNTPDRIKYGGGSRVKKVVLDDKWDVDGSGSSDNDVKTYGQYYEYTKKENGQTISSGVATNEPNVGYEECALKYAKEWTNKSYLKTQDNIFFEYPINEAYMPGASVGYSEVTVKSLATHLAANPQDDMLSVGVLPEGFGTTGVTVNKFYTAKDFPILVDETPLASWTEDKIKPFILASFTTEKFTGSQGYAITLNDMHGKPKEVTHYSEGTDGLNEVNKVEYAYKSKKAFTRTVSGKEHEIQVLDNEVEVLEADDPTAANASRSLQNLGVDYDFFIDMREHETMSESSAFGFNSDYTPPWFFLGGGSPLISTHEGRTRTMVANKIIKRTGILTTTDAYDGQSHITTTNQVFDPLNGEPLLTVVNNSFDNPIYNYNIPARFAYEQMGPAYENWGSKFEARIYADASCGLFRMNNMPTQIRQNLRPGDDVIVTDILSGGGCSNYGELCENRKFTFVRQKGGKFLFENSGLTDEYNGALVELMIIRSGNRNHISAKSGSITALSDPTKNRTVLANNDPLVTADVSTPSGNQTFTVPTRQINNVLNASAVTYAEFWDLERYMINPEETSFEVPDAAPSTNSAGSCTCYYLVAQGNFEPGQNCPVNVVITYTTLDGRTETITTSASASNPEGSDFPVLCSDNIVSISITQISLPTGCDADALLQTGACSQDPNCPGCDGDGGSGGSGSGGSTTTVAKAFPHYKYGQKGIWRPYQNFTYVDDRASTIREVKDNYNDTPTTETDGYVNNLTLFNWTNPFFKYTPAAAKWKETNRITKYASNGEEVENRDIIGLYSSALYAYNDNLPIAVAANASNYEIAYEGFETLRSEGEKGNLNFACADNETGPKKVFITNTYEIMGGYDHSSGQTDVYIDKPYYNNANLGDAYALLVLEDEDGKEYELTGDVASLAAGMDNVFGKNMSLLGLTNISGCEYPTKITTGKVVIKQEREIAKTSNPNCVASVGYSGVRLASDWKHSGNYSLKLEPGASSVSFEQASTDLIPGKQYVLSAWVSRGADYEGFTLASNINIAYDGGDATDPVYCRPSGPMINGWQRIEQIFTAEESEGSSADGLWEITFNRGGDNQYSAYFDDIRIYPLDGNIQTYVYNPVNYRLSAVLDNNNYATFYHYDEEGNLYLVKKETAEGIKTIQETREYVKVFE